MNDSDKRFLNEHKRHILRTLDVIESATAAGEPEEAAKIGIATMLVNIYSGMEIMLRHLLESGGCGISKSGTWHKEILEKAVSSNIISPELYATLFEYLQFRHRHIHGYGFMLDWERMKPLVLSIGKTSTRFLDELTAGNYLSQ